MRALILCLLFGCGGSQKPSEDPPPPTTGSLLDCERVAERVATTVDASSPRPGATHAAVKGMISTRCRTDGWSDATRQCLHAMTSIREGRACATGMTDEQRDAIRAHARSLRADASASADTDGPATDWIKHVVED
jgi:hypothetical protein